jgi:hypothetical protein
MAGHARFIPIALGLALALVWAIVPGPAWAGQSDLSDLSDADRTAIRSVIQRQLDAFKRDDGPAAFALASPAIQARFRDAARFLAMVRQSYQPVYRPRDVKFLDAAVQDGQVVQRVLVVGPDGVQVLAVYPMVRMPDGSWATDGCVLVDLPSKSA